MRVSRTSRSRLRRSCWNAAQRRLDVRKHNAWICRWSGPATSSTPSSNSCRTPVKEYKGSTSIDAGLVAAAQAVEHYQIARYGTLIAWATSLSKDDIVELLNATLEDEKATDEALTSLGESGVNDRAAEQQKAA